MSDTPKEVCWIALDREVAERKCGKIITATAGQRDTDEALIEDACRKSLVTECVELDGSAKSGKYANAPGWSVKVLPKGKAGFLSFTEESPLNGPCRVIVIAGERDG